MASIMKDVEAVGNEQTRAFNEAEQQIGRLREALLSVRNGGTAEELASLAAKAKESSSASVLAKRHQSYHARLSQLSRSLSEFQSIAEEDVTKAIRQHVMPKSAETVEQQADFSRYMRKIVAVHLLQTGKFEAFESFVKEVEHLDGITDLVPEQEAERMKSNGELEEAIEWFKGDKQATGRATALRKEIVENTRRDLLLQKVCNMIGSCLDPAAILEYIRDNFGGGASTVGDEEQQKRLQSCLLVLALPATKRDGHLAEADGLDSDALDRFWTLYYRGTWPGHVYSPPKEEPAPTVEDPVDEPAQPSECPPPKRYRLWTPEPREGYARTGNYSACIAPSVIPPGDVEETITTTKASSFLRSPRSTVVSNQEGSSSHSHRNGRTEGMGCSRIRLQRRDRDRAPIRIIRRSPESPRTTRDWSRQPRSSAEYISPRAPRPTAIQLHDANFVMRILAENARRVVGTPDPPSTPPLDETPTEPDDRFIRSSRVLSQPSEGDVPGVPKESPLYLLLASGRVAVRQLLEVQSVVQRHEMLGVPCESLPVEFDLPERFTPHSVFTCPVSRKMTTTADDWDRPDFPIILFGILINTTPNVLRSLYTITKHRD
ncbi:hypothetical protein Pmar_PMAR026508 [Perkinsus marinus ATCC 50983]|uniref:LisH domain-containing protein n=1 Tax=Perkinsus marinus (strain ATCC 50983 / TXsc) TaxID=423536 RepID=C5LDR0_PERM5|nr:hypothetical protein Pmar_PMAR026508 [Perkinsus marinus ATCC 50983]EER05074.1 hypothetical protein Pmar_PMAR026508 [Perkinsus marinus ATCC 50983]|eukprot:XP_002773258.1 hypothetical protein Pmar_PMAR026508 [Perkinsus marinus ATCC 50983]